jgi:4a-hydroxytetrahydrobiopterin dehydratase
VVHGDEGSLHAAPMTKSKARAPLSSGEIAEALAALPGWRFEDDALRKTFALGTHRRAIAFLVRVAFEAEQRDHHAEIRNVYATVELALHTHDAGNEVTAADVELARAIEAVSRETIG